ncbi:MAG TPA: gas vesicle protein GvpJ [Terriglobales bacterium]|nr:gas vesicle protein GvpJ [Terriglobales bacterium]
MTVERKSPGTELIDILDRVLDKGTVVDASSRLRLATNELRSMRAHMVVDSMDTYAGHIGLPQTNYQSQSPSFWKNSREGR